MIEEQYTDKDFLFIQEVLRAW